MAHCKNDQLEIIGLAVKASLFFQRKILVNWVAKVYYIECMSAIITRIKFPFKRRDNPTAVCALLISSPWY